MRICWRFVSPLADLKVFEVAKSLSVGTFGSACSSFRVVRFRVFVSPRNPCLRRGLLGGGAMVRSDLVEPGVVNSVPKRMRQLLRSTETQGCRMCPHRTLCSFHSTPI